MAVTHPVARRYARALFDLALQKEVLDTVQKELVLFDQLLQEKSRIRAILVTPEVNNKYKETAAREICKSNSAIFRNFILLLLKKRRLETLSDIRQEFDRLYDRQKNRVRAAITSAVELERETLDKTREELSRLLKADVSLETKVDPDILGGLIIQVDGTAMDGSLRRQLSLLKERLLNHSLA